MIITISKECARKSGSVDYIEIISLHIKNDKHKLRVHIRSNHHQELSFSRIERWSGARWNEIHRLLCPETARSLSARKDGKDDSHFEADRQALLTIAQKVLG